MEKRGQARGNGKLILFLLFAVFGVYFLNLGLKFVDLSKISFIDSISNIIMIIGGGLLILAGVMSLRRNPSQMMYPPRRRLF